MSNSKKICGCRTRGSKKKQEPDKRRRIISAALFFLSENGCITADPKFVDPANGDFRLQTDSPCVNKGLNADWMTTNEIDPVTGKRKKVLDLAGSLRISPKREGARVDIGCYEVWFPLGTIISVH